MKCPHCGEPVSAISTKDHSELSLTTQASEPFQLIVERASRSSGLSAGQVFEITTPRVIIGRDPRCDIHINDATVSRRHIQIRQTQQGPLLESLSKRPNTFLDKTALAAGDTTTLSGSQHYLQLGQILFRLDVDGSTEPVHEVLEQPREVSNAAASPLPLLSVKWSHNSCHIRCKGKLFNLFPVSARVLGTLLESPSTPVHIEEIRAIIGDGPQIEQQMTYIRQAFERLVDVNLITHDELRHQIRTNTVGAHLKRLDSMNTKQLLRYFISAKRGYGYTINLQPELVELNRPDTSTAAA